MRMSLEAVVKGKIAEPVRVVVYGTEGVGKSTFASGAPSPIYLGAEDGTAQLDVHRLPQPATWDEALEGVALLAREKHEYRTLVVDTLDWLEPLVWDYICKRDRQESVESYGYGKGYVVALDEWRRLLRSLESLRKKGMHVILLAHSWTKPFKNPMGDDYDRFEMKLNNKAAGLIKEWSDAVLFARHEEFSKSDAKTRRVRGVSTGRRIAHTERTAAFDAKNRYGLPPEIELSWADFSRESSRPAGASSAALRADILARAEGLDPETEAKVRGAVAAANDADLPAISARVGERLAMQRTAASAEVAP